jgi:hypothetical protein
MNNEAVIVTNEMWADMHFGLDRLTVSPQKLNTTPLGFKVDSSFNRR